MEPIVISITSGVVFYAVWRLWSRDRQALRATQAALSVVSQERDEAIVDGKLAYARGHEDGLQHAREQDQRERLIRVRKQQTAAAEKQVRLN